MMADNTRVYPERPLIQMLLASYEQGAWKDASLNWVEETEENTVEVIATCADGKTLALEHTLIELFVGEKYDSTIFTGAFEARIEKNPEFIISGRALNVMIPVGALVGVKDRDAAGQALLAWMRANHASIPAGESEQTIMIGGSVSLKVNFKSDDSQDGMGYCWLARCDKPSNINKIVEKAIKRKVPKLVRAQADKRILLLQREHISMGDTEILELVEKIAPQYPDLAKVDEIWFVNTSIMESEGWVYLSRLHRGPTQIMRFQNGMLKHRRDDALGINEYMS
jgi:hypothetical protein